MNKLYSAAALLVLAVPSWASLTTFQTFVGSYGVSTDGFGSTSDVGSIQASVPFGATVVAAYLYTGYYGSSGGIGGTLNGNAVSYGAPVDNATGCCGIGSARADVTAIVAPVINGGLGGTYSFSLTETSGSQDGEALVVVYSLNTLAVSPSGILDGYASVTGDTASIAFASPLAPASPGFVAEMYLGINFSCCSQSSTVTVNSNLISTEAGNNDDSADPSLSNGNLITVGGFDDPYSSLLPAYGDDHERYNLVPYISVGDTLIRVDTANPTGDDNIFLAVFKVSGVGTITSSGDVPEPGSLLLFGTAIATLGWRRFRRSAR